jgi:magnesium transporter
VFQVIDLGPDGKLVASAGAERAVPPPDGTIRWIDLVEPDPASLEIIRSRFDLHPLAIEDCATFGLQSKVDDYERYLFVVIHSFTADPTDPLEIQIHEIHAFVSESYIITVHDNPLPSHDAVWTKAAGDKATLERGPSWVLYRHIDAMVEATEPLVMRIRDQLDDLEWAVIEEEGGGGRGRAIDLKQVFRIKRTSVAMRRVIRPLRDTIGILHRRNDPRISQRSMLHMRDVADHVARLAEMIEETREVSVGVVANHQAFAAQKVNEIMRGLTIFSAIFLPLSFIVGFFGQNFVDLPYDSDIWLAIMIVSLIVIPAGLFEWFRRNGWL